jgi:spore coat protein JC
LNNKKRGSGKIVARTSLSLKPLIFKGFCYVHPRCTDELAHMEIVAALVYNLIKDAPLEQIKAHGMDGYYADHDRALYFVDATGNPWTATYIQSKGDPITDLHENMAAEEKARSTYEWLINLSNDPLVTEALRFLRVREIVHFQRFGETLRLVQEWADRKKIY